MIMEYAVIEKNRQILEGIYEAVLICGENMPPVKPGQFINVYPKNPALTLPRPISICDVPAANRLRIIYKVVGKGTEELSCYKRGDTVRITYPLGNGFDTGTDDERHIIVGGGIGAAPLLYLAKSLKGRVSVFLGFLDDPMLEGEFKTVTKEVFIATETGAYGNKGTVIDMLKNEDITGGRYYICGPAPMLKALCAYLNERQACGQISLEARMGCGFGVCVCCAVKTIGADGNWQYSKACTDGPVFDYREVLWD